MYGNKLILIVDDSKEIRFLLKLRLEMSRFRVIEAENGKSGLEFAVNHFPDLIISDYSMPELNGIELAKALRSNDGTKDIPFVLLSSFPFGRDLSEKIHESGIDYYMMKPYEFDELFNVITGLLMDRDSRKLFFRERRSSARFQTISYAQVEVNKRSYLARIKDMSKDGLSLELPEDTQVGTILKINFKKASDIFSGNARVVWVSRDETNKKFLTGVEME